VTKKVAVAEKAPKATERGEKRAVLKTALTMRKALKLQSKKSELVVPDATTLQAVAQYLLVEQTGFPEAIKRTTSSIAEDDECDTVTKKNGDEISCIVKEITPNEIKYVRCGNQDGPLISISKSDVFSIKYKDGTKEMMNSSSSGSNSASSLDKEPEVLGIVSAGLGFLGLILLLTPTGLVAGLLGLLLAIGAVVTGFISLGKFKKEPNRYSLKGLAITGISLGGLMLLLFLILIAVAL